MQNATPNSVPTLIPCKDCNLAFCCSDAHWEAVRYLHTVTPEDDVLGGLSQCKLNQRFHYDWALERDIYRGHRTVLESHPWRPKAKNTAWTSLKGATWDIFFDDFIQQRCTSGRLTRPEIDARFRAATDYLSLPMTTLYALEGMNDGSDWTRKETLVIHV
jgi:splicing suppressor protein 51